MPKCEYCNEPATEKRMVYDPDMQQTVEKDVCADCGLAIDEKIL